MLHSQQRGKIAGTITAAGTMALATIALTGLSTATPVQAQKNQSKKMAAPSAARYRADRFTTSWPAKSREVAMKMMKKYGSPQEATRTRLIWHNNGPWKQTIVYRDPIQHDFPMPHKDLLEQFINYQVPAEKFDELAMYDGSVIPERTKGEISARCDKEEANFLALNLANDIITGKTTVDEARTSYAQNIKDLMAGKKPAYTQKLQFDVAKNGTGYTDKPAPSMQGMK